MFSAPETRRTGIVDHPHSAGPRKNGLPPNLSQVPRRLGTTGERTTRTTAAQAPLQVAEPTEMRLPRGARAGFTWDVVGGDGQDEQRSAQLLPPGCAALGPEASGRRGASARSAATALFPSDTLAVLTLV